MDITTILSHSVQVAHETSICVVSFLNEVNPTRWDADICYHTGLQLRIYNIRVGTDEILLIRYCSLFWGEIVPFMSGSSVYTLLADCIEFSSCCKFFLHSFSVLFAPPLSTVYD